MSGPNILLERLQPGDCIDFSDITEIPAFEDMVAESIDGKVDEIFPERHNVLNKIAWGARVAIGELIRPPKFNGAIKDISLTVMGEPYEKLASARERGWKIGAINVTRTKEDEQSLALLSEYRGFEFRGSAYSSGRGVIGQIAAELWYAPVPLDSSGSSTRPHQQIDRYAGSSILRLTTKPKLESEKFVELSEESRGIAFEVLKRNMSHPIIQPMRK